MKEKNGIEKLYGLVVAPAKSCDSCPNNKGCYKIDVLGIGFLCLMREPDALRHLESKYEALQDESATMSKELVELREKINALEESKGRLKDELEGVHKANESLSELNDERLLQIKQLRKRGFWARVLNRDE